MPFGGRRESPTTSTRRRLSIERELIYAVGDVHGCLASLLQLEELIADDAASLGQRGTVILLGDVVDRGPNSAQVIDHILERQRSGDEYFCVLGNHEEAMLDYLRTVDPRSDWLRHGGLETLASYGVSEHQASRQRLGRRAIEATVPHEHVIFLETLPISISTSRFFFSHAGARPGIPLNAQPDGDLLYFRDGTTASYEEFDRVVVHGHEVVRQAVLRERRINLDTGVFATGRLTAARLFGDRPPVTLVAEKQATNLNPVTKIE